VELAYELENTNGATLSSLLQETAVFLWKDWPRDMRVVLSNLHNKTFTLRGSCPHGPHESAFLLVTGVYVDPQTTRWIAAMQCQGCAKYILAIMQVAIVTNSATLQYEDHYPIGTPDDTVDAEIPPHIQPDFKEALRCLSVNAYNATAEMCRRAIEASCLNLGAPKKKVLDDMIDWLADQRIITPFLQKVAHKIRLGGNKGAHPEAPEAAVAVAVETEEENTGPVMKIEKEHAEAIVKFTREFFHHVYVVPKQLEKYDFSKPKVKP
jgi:hypothetical protein